MGASVAAQLITVTPVIDTAIYAVGDVLFDKAEIANSVLAKGRAAELVSITALDKADQGTAFDLLFFTTATSIGAANAAFAASDALMAECQLIHRVAAADFVDVGGARIANLGNIRKFVEAAATTRSLWVAGIVQSGTPTYGAASDLVLTFGLIWH